MKKKSRWTLKVVACNQLFLIPVRFSKSGKITIGHIYVYVTPEPYSCLVCHRLIAQSEEKLFFQGDNRRSADQFVTRESIIGRCIAYILNNRIVPLEEG